MQPSPSAQLLSALTAERALLLKFFALLEREQRMLVENLTDPLLELSEQKSADAFALNELAATRRALFRKHLPQLGGTPTPGTPPDAHPSDNLGADAIRAWLETHNPEGLAVWQEILALAERAQRLNQTNGELIQMKLRRNQQLLAVLSSAVNKANLYGPDGQTSFSPGSGRSLGSG